MICDPGPQNQSYFSKLRFIHHMNKLSIDVWFVMIGQYLAEIQLFENIEKITFKVVQTKFLAMHITNQKMKI